MFFNKQIFFIQSLPIHNSPVPRCATHFGKLSKFAKVFLEHSPQNPTSPTPPTSPKSPIKSNFFSPNLQRRMSEGLAKDNALPPSPTPPTSPKSPTSPINSKFKIQNSKFKILLKALIIKHYFVPLPPAKAVVFFGTIYAMFLW